MESAVPISSLLARPLLPFLAVFLTSFVLPTASNRIVFFACVPFMLWTLWQNRDEVSRYVRTPTFGLFAAYLCYFGASVFWSGANEYDGPFKTLRDVASIIIFCTTLAVLLPTMRLPEKLPLYFAVLCAGYALALTVYYYGVEGRPMIWRLEGIGRYQNSIHFGFLMSFAIIALICRMIASAPVTGREKIIEGVLIAALLIFIALSQTRSAYIGLAACLGALLVFGHARSAGIIAASAVIITAVLYVSSDKYAAMFAGRLDSYRFNIWADAFQGFLEKPIFGHGILHEPRFFPEALDEKRGWKSPHNAFLGHAFVGGIVGFTLFMGLVGRLCWIAGRSYLDEKRRDKKTLMTLFGIMTFCFALTVSLVNFSHYVVNVHIQWLVFWVPFAILWSMDVNRARDRAC